MTRVDDTAWVPKAKKRKAYRDHYRDKFFNDVDMKRCANEKDITGAPQKQRLAVVRLLNITRSGMLDHTHNAMITTMAKTIATNGLGKGIMGSVGDTQDDLKQYTMKNLRDFFHSPAFFD